MQAKNFTTRNQKQTSKKTVLQVYKLYAPETGGVISIMRNLTAMLGEKYNINVLTTRTKHMKKREFLDNANVMRCRSLGTLLSMPIAPFLPFAFWKSARKADLVTYHYPTPWFDIAIASFFPARTKLIIYWHAEISAKKQRPFVRLLGPCIRRSLERADCIIVSNPNMVKYSAFLPQFKDKCHVVPFGIDTAIWKQKTPENSQTVAALQKTYGKFFLACGRLVPYKGYEVLIKALEGSSIRVLVAGAGPLWQNLHNLARSLAVDSQIAFLGTVEHQELLSLYQASYAFVFPSVAEGEAFGLAQLEAMATGKAIVNTNLKSGVPWVARDGIEAITVPCGDSLSLREAMIRLYEDPKLAEQLGSAGRRRYELEFSKDTFTKNCMQVYDSILSD